MIVDMNTLERRAVVNRIAELEQELFGAGAWSAAAVEEELAAPARTYLLDVEDGGEKSHTSTPMIRGYAGYWYDGDDAELMTIGVATTYQRQGIAAALLSALIDRARAQGARRMLLEVRVDNDPALALYQKAGFTRLGLRKRYYQPGNIDAYTMALDLMPRIVGFASAHAVPTQTSASSTTPSPPTSHDQSAPVQSDVSAHSAIPTDSTLLTDSMVLADSTTLVDSTTPAGPMPADTAIPDSAVADRMMGGKNTADLASVDLNISTQTERGDLHEGEQ